MKKILYPIPSVFPISNPRQSKFKMSFLTAHGPEGQSRNRPQSCSAVLNLLRHAIGKDPNENKLQVHSWLIRTFSQIYSFLSAFEEVNWDCLCPAELQLPDWLRFPEVRVSLYVCFINHF